MAQELEDAFKAMSLQQMNDLNKRQDAFEKEMLGVIIRNQEKWKTEMGTRFGLAWKQERDITKESERVFRLDMDHELRKIEKRQADFETEVTTDLRCLQSRELMLGIRLLVLTARRMYQVESFCENCGKGIPLTSGQSAVLKDDPVEKATPEDIVKISHGILNGEDLKLLKFSERNGDETDITAYENWYHLAMLLILPSYIEVKEKYSNLFKWVVGQSIEHVAEKAYLLHIKPYWQ
ncbi:hypothetical protein TWF506_000753 [Arthrobotrys conoides]|uniref:Uncharacterized protein n=1 Tax=Arthrobotrys conoides TaxID=74498 RepID=A0AAN8RXU7_9PEZI